VRWSLDATRLARMGPFGSLGDERRELLGLVDLDWTARGLPRNRCLDPSKRESDMPAGYCKKFLYGGVSLRDLRTPLHLQSGVVSFVVMGRVRPGSALLRSPIHVLGCPVLVAVEGVLQTEERRGLPITLVWLY
jgi:hypothetical protein